jgi:endoribonuclease LACTB2
VAGLGTVVIDPPEGDMAEYVRQLERLKGEVRTLYPAHGPVVPDGVAKLDEYLAHRRWREARVIEALASLGRPAALSELLPLAYDDVAAFVLPLAQRSARAILEKLKGEGRVRLEGERWVQVRGGGPG